MIKQLVIFCLGAITALGAAAESSTIKIERFQQLSVSGHLNVDCIHNPDSVGYLKINCPDRNKISWVVAENNGDKLKLRLILPDDVRTGLEKMPANLPNVTVYTNYLTRVENDGDSTTRVLTAADVPQFEARLMGNGRLSVRGINAEKLKATLFTGSGIIVLNGKSDEANYSLIGVGTIQADGVECRKAGVRITGTGSVGVHATQELKIHGSGSGTVYYRGTPEFKKKVAIGLKVQPIE